MKTIKLQIFKKFQNKIYGKDDALFDRKGNNVSRQVENVIDEIISLLLKQNKIKLKKAFEAGRTVKNHRAEWQETYSDEFTSAKYTTFKDFINN